MFRLKRHIALVSILVLLLPSVILLVHSFENHKHPVCSSTSEQHFHEQELNCSLLNFNFQVFSLDFNSSYDLIPVTYFKTRQNLQPQFIPVHHVVKILPRGPPFNLI